MLPEPTRAELARELLLDKMREYSQDGFCASWMQGLEFELWQLATSSSPTESSGFSPEFYQQLHQLTVIADGWWRWETTSDSSGVGPVFVSLGTWQKVYHDHEPPA